MSSGWQNLSGWIIASPAIAFYPNGTPLFIATGSNHELYDRTLSLPWAPLGPPGTYCMGSPAATITQGLSGPSLTVACEGGNQALFAATLALPSSGLPLVSAWSYLGGQLSAGPAVAPVGGTITYFAVGAGAGQVSTFAEGTGWVGTPWYCVGHPSAAVAGEANGAATTFACDGVNGSLWSATSTGGSWSAAVNDGGVVIGGPGVAATPSGTVFILAEGTDQTAWVWTSTSGWSELGGAIVGGVGATAVVAAPSPPPPSPVALTTSSLPAGTVGSSYTATLAATGGTAPYTFSATGLPAGLSVSGATVVGTPKASGTTSVVVSVSDSSTPPQTASATLSLAVSPAPPPQPSGAPTSAPVTWCETGLPTSPYASAPATPLGGTTSVVTVPAGDNSSLGGAISPNTTYWFAPGTHTIGTGQFNSIGPSNGDIFVGAPGAVLDGQNANNFAFEGSATDTSNENVTIEYLTIQHFDPPNSAGAINQNGNSGWTVEDDLVQYNSPGAGVLMGSNNVVSDNCLTENGEYGAQGVSWVENQAANTFTGGSTNITFTDNEVSFNNTMKTQAGVEGGVKFWQNGDVVADDNYVHDNIESPGLWFDTDNAGMEVEGNYIANNGGQGLDFEVSYNGVAEDNTFIGNDIQGGESNEGFPNGAIYVSESGGYSSVPSTYAGELLIQDNVFTDNWGGVTLYQNADRSSADGSDPGTLTPPPGVNVDTWINSAAATDCAANLAETTPVDYNALCQWKTQNVTVQNNTFTIDPSLSQYGGQCTEANACNQNAEFMNPSGLSSSQSPNPGWSGPNAISNLDNNVFKDNTYVGPWTFMYFAQGDMESFAQWQAGATNVQGSGFNFPPQDAGSTLSG